MYMVAYFTNVSGKSPIKEFINDLNIKQRGKIFKQFTYIQRFGLTKAIPNIKKLTSNIWELRILGQDNFRIICSQVKVDLIVVLHVFVKQSAKTPERAIKLAETRLNKLIDKKYLIRYI